MSTREIPLQVSARVLRHISRGIYRTPAGALKELISNSYDAGARKVTINSGYPSFEKIVVTDDGSGMSESEFENIIQNIGLSEKVAGTEFSLPDSNTSRVTIGHYGIGMLAIGQLCKRARITSKGKNYATGFEAVLDFEQFEVKKEDDIERSVIKDEVEIEKQDKSFEALKKSDEKKFPIGKCVLKTLPFAEKDRQSHFTRVELEQVRDLVQKKLSGGFYQEYRDLSLKKHYSANFAEVLKLFREHEEDIRRGQYPYEKLCWELAVYCPLKYPTIGEFKNGHLKEFSKLVDKTHFELVLDGMQLYKPYEKVLFEETDYPIRKIFTWANQEYVPKKFVSGFIIHRQRIRPKSMQGILIRVGGVTVGTYDLTFMEYPYHEATKFEQLSGELFVEGLSSALNIDRNSFNETDDYYLGLVKWFHQKLIL